MSKNSIIFNSLESKMELWIKRGWNVLFTGKAGVGKTSLIKNAFEKANLRYKMFSASTLDPWVDFIGIPKETSDDDGIPYIKLIKPKVFAKDEIEAIFLDEFNRSTKKIRNAVMELIQFKSINGDKFNNLKIVWAAINPDEESSGGGKYDVEPLDPAQKDRFHIHVQIPYECSETYFIEKYKNKEMARTTIKWWDNLNMDNKEIVSPRRLDYALEVFLGMGSLEDVIPLSANPSELRDLLQTSPIESEIDKIFKENDKEKAQSLLEDDNNLRSGINHICSKNSLLNFFAPFIPKENFASLIVINETILRFALDNYNNIPAIKEVFADIIDAEQNMVLINKIKKRYDKDNKSKHIRNFFYNPNTLLTNSGREPSYYAKETNPEYSNIILKIMYNNNISNEGTTLNPKLADSSESLKLYTQIHENLPKNISYIEAKQTFLIINEFIRSNSYRIIRRWNNFMGIINHLIDTLVQNKINMIDIPTLYPDLCNYLNEDNTKFYFKLS